MVCVHLLGAQRIGHGDQQVGAKEREVVVAAVPDQDIGFLSGRLGDGSVVDTGEHSGPGGDVRFVFLAFLDGAPRFRQVGQGREALHALQRQVTVGHGVADHRDLVALASDRDGQPARNRGFAAAGAKAAHRDHRSFRGNHGAVRSQQPEIGPGGQRPRRQMHHRGVRQVAVGEDDFIDGMHAAKRFQVCLRLDRDALGIARPGQCRRIAPVRDSRDLRGGKGDHPRRGIVAINLLKL